MTNIFKTKKVKKVAEKREESKERTINVWPYVIGGRLEEEITTLDK